MPTTTTGISPMHLTLSNQPASASGRDLVAAVRRKARKADWDELIVRADRAVSIAGTAAVIVSLLYFVPIFINMLAR